MVYLTLAQKVEVMGLVNEVGLVLFEFYLSKIGVDQYQYTDEKTARSLNWTVRKVANTRRDLIKHDLYKEERDRISTIYTIGQMFMTEQSSENGN